ncbi:hypothetical protein ELH51_05885 [Rhizobium ruizarguesonis]|uniref:hypothetical protein n=1 Tax=Rhizobium ruizarguesonis TaxID=2081791 RepID=UPI001030C366|nr:hypothetical protein [Rhizobium ruizarguesonis]TBB21339.1 hypothetical protein ELH51_05885 [Rhizobium ruizarguesonis]
MRNYLLTHSYRGLVRLIALDGLIDIDIDRPTTLRDVVGRAVAPNGNYLALLRETGIRNSSLTFIPYRPSKGSGVA